MKIECEEIISFDEIVEFSEDDEPPSGRVGIINTSVLNCIDGHSSRVLLGKSSSSFSKNFSPETDLKFLKNWRWPISNVTSVGRHKSMLRHIEQTLMLVVILHFLALYITP
ncbi:MAG: hypothetical protein AB7S48_10780 [Bacteroidales bacterium]